MEKDERDAKQLLQKLIDVPVPWYDICTDEEFMMTPREIFLAEAEVNRRICEDSTVYIEDWAEILGIDHPWNPADCDCGWAQECLLEAGMNWLYFHYYYKDEKFYIEPDLYPCNGLGLCYNDCGHYTVKETIGCPEEK